MLPNEVGPCGLPTPSRGLRQFGTLRRAAAAERGMRPFARSDIFALVFTEWCHPQQPFVGLGLPLSDADKLERVSTLRVTTNGTVRSETHIEQKWSAECGCERVDPELLARDQIVSLFQNLKTKTPPPYFFQAD